MPDQITLGWHRRRWSRRTACVICDARIRKGITRLNDRGDPPHHAMCDGCYSALLESEPGSGFEDTPRVPDPAELGD